MKIYLLVFLLFCLSNRKKTQNGVLACGLVGYCGDVPFNLDKIKTLMILNQERGEHSSGYFNNNTSKQFKDNLGKKMGKTTEKLLPKDFNITPSKLFIGHTRHATIGVKNLDNAHPFIFGNTVGAHNGTLKNLDLLLKKYKSKYPNKKFNTKTISVDSKIFPYYFDTADNLGVLSDIDGAAAVLWHKKDSEILNIFRNFERPLHYGFIETDGGRGIYISSEKYPLEIIGCKDIDNFNVQNHYRLKNGDFMDEKPTYIMRHPVGLNNFTRDNKHIEPGSNVKPSETMAGELCSYCDSHLTEVKYTTLVTHYKTTPLEKSNGIMIEGTDGEIDIIYTDTFADRVLEDVYVRFEESSNKFILHYSYTDHSQKERKVANVNELTKNLLKTYGERKKLNGNSSDNVIPFMDSKNIDIYDNELPNYGPKTANWDNIANEEEELIIDEEGDEILSAAISYIYGRAHSIKYMIERQNLQDLIDISFITDIMTECNELAEEYGISEPIDA